MKIKVTGMTCASCSGSVKRALEKMPGVMNADVDHASGMATVSYKGGGISASEMRRSIESSGYGVEAQSVEVRIDGMTCASCSSAVEAALTSIPGVISANVNLSNKSAIVRFLEGTVPLSTIRDAVNGLGYSYQGVIGKEEADTSDREGRKQRLRLIRIILGFSISLPMLALMHIDVHLPVDMSLSFLMITVPVLSFIGYPIFRSAFTSLLHRSLTMDVMYAMGISAAFISSVMGTFGIVLDGHFNFYDTTIMLASFLTLGRYLENRAMSRTGDAVRKLIGLRPRKANRLVDGRLEIVDADELSVGDLFVIRPGERVPVDGRVKDGRSYVDESMINGEPIPSQKGKGEEVIGGTLNQKGVLTVEATRVGADTMLSQIVRLVSEAQSSKPALQKIADRVVTYFIPAVLAISIGSFVLWYLVLGESLLFSLTALISVMVIACPCALGLASPTAVTVGIGRGAEMGILIKGGDILERAERIDTVLFDKTGTVTMGRPEVTSVDAFGIDEGALLSFVAPVESLSDHPLARAITERAKMSEKETDEVRDFELIEGRGVMGTVKGSKVRIGNRRMMKEGGIEIPPMVEERMERMETEGKTASLVSISGRIAGLIGIEDPVKEGASEAVSSIKSMGIRTMMVTGDNPRTAKAVARKVGIDEVLAEVLPGGKSEKVVELQRKGRKVAFIGDGINDAPALARSDVGIAIGTGTDIAIDSAGIVLVSGKLNNALHSLKLSRKVMGRVRMNLFWAFAYNTALIPAAAGALHPLFGVHFRPEWGALAMALSSVTVISLSLMLKRYDPASG